MQYQPLITVKYGTIVTNMIIDIDTVEPCIHSDVQASAIYVQYSMHTSPPIL